MAALDLEGQQEYLAVAFLLNADRTRYASYLQGVENDYLQGQDKYPKTVEEAHNVLTNWKQEPHSMMLGGTNDGVMFAPMQAGAIDASEEAEAIALATNGADRRLTAAEFSAWQYFQFFHFLLWFFSIYTCRFRPESTSSTRIDSLDSTRASPMLTW
jgi:hypothetical protein